MDEILAEKHTVKTKRTTNWSMATFSEVGGHEIFEVNTNSSDNILLRETQPRRTSCDIMQQLKAIIYENTALNNN